MKIWADLFSETHSEYSWDPINLWYLKQWKAFRQCLRSLKPQGLDQPLSDLAINPLIWNPLLLWRLAHHHMVPLFFSRMEHQPYRHKQGILVHGAGRRDSGYDVCLLSLSPSDVGLLKLTPLLDLCLCPWNLIPPPASLQCSEDHVSMEQSDWSLWVAMGATEICQLLALFLLICLLSGYFLSLPWRCL